MEKIRVYIDGEIYRKSPFGGIARYFGELISRLASQDEFDIRLDGPRAGHAPIGLRTHLEATFRPGRVSKWWHRNKPNRWEPEIFHSTYYTPPPDGFTGRVILSLHDFIDAELPFCQPNGNEFVVRQMNLIQSADRIIAVSETTANKAKALVGVAKEKISVIHPAASEFWASHPGPLQPTDRIPLDITYWLFVGCREHCVVCTRGGWYLHQSRRCRC